ncbi:MAG: DUF58 domain-containing protein [Dehalococcoidales bacterium]|nr:DUF58 domain-containing protein [Dehalococcoidales bacterium]
MRRLPRLCQLYVFLLLLVTAILSAPPYLILSLVLLVGMLFLTLRPVAPPRFNIIAAIGVIFLLPPALVTPIGQITNLPATAIELSTAISVLPVVYLLDYYLRQYATRLHPIPSAIKGRRVTTMYRTLLSTILVTIVIAILLDVRVLLATAIIFASYLLVITLHIFFTVPRASLAPASISRRVIAHATAEATLEITSRAKAGVYGAVQPVDPWLEITPQYFALKGNTAKLVMRITPPLSGTSRPMLLAAVCDIRGLVQVNEALEPLELHVIPRARYAEWLAGKYLEQSGAGAVPSTDLTSQELLATTRGIEYQSSRSYQPGDPLQGIDWKHTMKLQQFIISEFAEAGMPPAIIAVNLSVTESEEADNLAFNLVTAALTLARNLIPSALTVYNQQEVLLTTAVTAPEETLKRALALTKNITVSGNPQQYLEAPDVMRLRRSISELKRVESEAVRRLLDILSFEQKAIEKTAQENPATMALTLATQQVPAPAVVLLISQLNHDTEAVLVNTEKLARRNYTVLPIRTTI